MAYSEPLDKFDDAGLSLSGQEIIKRLQAAGYYESFENGNGNVTVKGVNSLNCEIKKEVDGSWTPTVSIEWLSVYVFVPAVVFIWAPKCLDLNTALAKWPACFWE